MKKSLVPDEIYIYIYEKEKFLLHSNENEISPLIYMNTITALVSNLEMNKITAVPRDPTLSTFQTLLGKHILEYLGKHILEYLGKHKLELEFYLKSCRVYSDTALKYLASLGKHILELEFYLKSSRVYSDTALKYLASLGKHILELEFYLKSSRVYSDTARKYIASLCGGEPKTIVFKGL